MKKITELDGVELLRQMNKTRKVVAACLAETGIMEIRKRKPNFPMNATRKEREEAIKKQQAENIEAMIEALLEEHPDVTLKLFDSMIVYDPKEAHLTGAELVSIGMSVIASPEVMRFFISCLSLANIV